LIDPEMYDSANPLHPKHSAKVDGHDNTV